LSFFSLAIADAAPHHYMGMLLPSAFAVAMFLFPATGYIAVTHSLGITSCCKTLTLLPSTLHHHCDAITIAVIISVAVIIANIHCHHCWLLCCY